MVLSDGTELSRCGSWKTKKYSKANSLFHHPIVIPPKVALLTVTQDGSFGSVRARRISLAELQRSVRSHHRGHPGSHSNAHAD